MAAELGVTGLQLRNWLRAEEAKGHPLLAGHEYRGAWRFPPEDAARLMEEFRAVGLRSKPPRRTPAPALRDSSLVARVHLVKGSHVADDVLRATRSLGGEDARGTIIDRALDLRGWSADELAVAALWKQPAHPGHLRAVVDSAITICGDRGLLERLGSGGRWRLPLAVGDQVGSPYRRATRSRSRVEPTVLIEMDLDGLDLRTDEHMELQDLVSATLVKLGLKPLSWKGSEPTYDLAFELGSRIVVVEVKTLGAGSSTQQMRLGLGQLLEYRHRLAQLHQREVRGLLVASRPVPDPWPAIVAGAEAVAISSDDLRRDLRRVMGGFRA